jgi:hypothetical protein
MIEFKSIVKDRKIVLDAPESWPDGTQVDAQIQPISASRIGIDESDWQDDAETLADWDSWITTIEPLEFTAEEKAAIARFDEQMRQFNIEAVRKQMGLGAAK